MDANSKNFTPRLPKFFYDTYRQYKENESIIVQWVHRTVAELRDRTRAASASIPRRGRAHGSNHKARTNKAAASAVLDSDLASPKLSLRTLLDLAREISASDVVIPSSYLALLELSIKQRKITAAFYSPDANVSEDNKAHLHAINAYTQLLQIFKEAENKRAEKHRGVPGDIQGALVLGNEDSFAFSEAIQNLAVLVQQESGFGTSQDNGDSAENEWIRDNPMVQSTHKRPKIPSFPLAEYGLVMDDEFDPKTKKKKPAAHDETFDRLRCFVFDVNQLRKYCNMIWKQVAPAGNLSYITASFVTNMAVQMVKQMEYALVTDFPSLKNIHHAYALLHDAIDRYRRSNNFTQDQFNSFNEQMMYHTWDALQQFAELLKVNNSPALRDGHFGYFDPTADRSKMSAQERFREDCCIIFNYWPDLIIVNNRILTSTGGTDTQFLGSQGLLSDFKQFCRGKTHTVTWALVFACQMQADSVQARRRYLAYDVQVMRNLGSKIFREYQHFQTDGMLYGENMSTIAKPFVEYASAMIENSVSEDFVTQMKLRNGWDKLSKQATQKDSLWLYNPWLTANVISELTLDYFYAGTAVTAAGGFVQSAIQLWNMLRQMGYLSPPKSTSAIVGYGSNTRKDHVLLFDHLMDVFGDKVFSGAPPKSDFLKAWELMTGVRAEEYARGKRQYKKTAERPLRPRHHESGRGMLPNMSELLLIHKGEYFPKDSLFEAQKRVSSGSSGSQYKHPLPALVDLVNSELGYPSTSPSSTTPPPPPAKGPFLNLDLLKIHRLCLRLFTELEPVLRPMIESILGVPLDHTQVQWPYLVGWIARTEQFPGNGGMPNRVLLSAAGEVVKRLVGDKELGHFLVRYEAEEDLILR
ncbi:hypothetical protein M413DRAFT_440469 [Hebeloma cylindrosporum]|uniref:DUF6604 domain-containing protein n=1 Tax=Hebeloma cylindrosporum TaxID=76867 RepID=A0A0C3CSL0_HEBCY|nr:hypothetical protein M413DRAFT_440469 [Hebeloma cylindrosporum h7]